MEVCPKCGNVSIEWNGGEFECLVRKCGYRWKKFDGPSIPYDEIKNSFLRCSVSPGSSLPGTQDKEILSLNSYQRQAGMTAVYPNAGNGNFIYPTLGLCGEAGELANKVKKVIRDYGGVLTQELKEKIVDELGDSLWYIAQIATELDVPLNRVAEINLDKLASRAERNKLHGSGDNR